MGRRRANDHSEWLEYAGLTERSAVVAPPRASCTEPHCRAVAVSWDQNRDGWCRFHVKQVNRGVPAPDPLPPEYQIEPCSTDKTFAEHSKQFERRSGESDADYGARLRKAARSMKAIQTLP